MWWKFFFTVPDVVNLEKSTCVHEVLADDPESATQSFLGARNHKLKFVRGSCVVVFYFLFLDNFYYKLSDCHSLIAFSWMNLGSIPNLLIGNDPTNHG